MCMHGIFLYVDWMWTSQLKDGKLIKNNLSKHLMESSQLLFLRTINSEFKYQRLVLMGIRKFLWSKRN